MIRFGLMAVLFLAATQLLVAQPRGPRGGGSQEPSIEQSKQVLDLTSEAALDAYREENIEPVLLRQRAKLEEKITQEDKATIAELRTFAEARKKERRENRADGTTRPNRGEREPNAERPEEMETLKTLVEKYKGDIKTLMEEIAEERKQWEEDLKAIKVTYLGERPEREGENTRRGRDRNNDRAPHHPHGAKGEHHKGYLGAAHFLLLDPNGNKPQVISSNKTLNTITSFPNPAANMTTVKYEVKQAGRIRIDIQDERGNVVKTLVDETVVEGTYTIDVNVNNFRNSTYYFVLTDSKGKVTQKTVIAQ